MSNPSNWPIAGDAETYFRHQEKRLLSEQRRPIVGHGNIVGPGIAPNASEVDDWNDDAAATNGYFWTPQGAPNAPADNPSPPYGDGIDPYPDLSFWLGHTVSMGIVGHQTLRLMSNSFDEDAPFYPDIEVHREWKTVASGKRAYGPWRGNANRPLRMVEVEYVGTGSAQAVGFDVDPDAPVGYAGGFYVPDFHTTWFFHIALTILNTSDALGTQSVSFWPTLNGLSLPASEEGDPGWWQHDGAGAGSFSERKTASRSWILHPQAGINTVQIAVNATAGLTIPWLDLYGFQIQ